MSSPLSLPLVREEKKKKKRKKKEKKKNLLNERPEAGPGPRLRLGLGLGPRTAFLHPSRKKNKRKQPTTSLPFYIVNLTRNYLT